MVVVTRYVSSDWGRANSGMIPLQDSSCGVACYLHAPVLGVDNIILTSQLALRSVDIGSRGFLSCVCVLCGAGNAMNVFSDWVKARSGMISLFGSS